MKRSRVVAIVSPKLEPRAVAGNVEKAEEARRALGPLGGVILEPLQVGVLEGADYAVFPYCRPVRIRRRFLRTMRRSLVGKRLLPWLRLATERTVQQPTAEERQDRFITPLEHLCDASSMPGHVRDAASLALGRLERGAWQPQLAIMHDDLNLHNLLQPPGIAAWNRTIIIDWERSAVRGYGFYDLIAMTLWMKLGRGRLRAEIDRHCRIMACDPVDVRGYMLATLGGKSMTLDEPLPNPVTRRPDDVVNDDVMGSISRDQRKTVVDVAAALARLKQLDSLEAYLNDRH
ncbi:hypothetical protein [Paludisphaera borealis]|nr:hypothetical protein [Paludisphaera borealis]